MKTWVFITNLNNWHIIREKNIWGVSKKFENIISRIKKGDKCLIYAKSRGRKRMEDRETEGWSKEAQIVAEYTIDSEVYEDHTNIFQSITDDYPLRIRLKPIRIYDEPIAFKKLVPKLDFITNKKRWGLHFFGTAIKEIPEKDYNKITSCR